MAAAFAKASSSLHGTTSSSSARRRSSPCCDFVGAAASRVSLPFPARPLSCASQLVARKAGGEGRSGRGLRVGFVVMANGSGNGREELQGPESSGFVPVAEFYKVEAIVRPWRLAHVASALIECGIRGVTVTDVRGFGSQGGSLERHAGSEFSEDSFVAKVKLEVVVSKDQVEIVIENIVGQARTGEIGDGKIFVLPVADIVRVRTGERGLKAERMAGGRADLLSTRRSN